MRAAAWYVHGVQLDWPNAEAWVSGPHDRADAFEAAARLRPLYPDATLSPRIRRTAGEPPRCTPRAMFDLRNVKGRRSAAGAIVERVQALGLEAIIEDWDGEPDVMCATPSLRANIWLAWTPLAPMPIINWYGARFPLQAVPGAWPDRFNAQRTKATSEPNDWPQLFEMLEIGLLAAVGGEAFDMESE